MKNLKGKNAVVTGAGSGIGRGICLSLASEGARVVVSDVDVASADAVVSELTGVGHEAIAVATDVSQRHEVKALAEQAISSFGPVHILCNNAGVFSMKNIRDTTLEDWKWVMSVNLDGVVNGLTQFLPGMIEHGEEAHIVNTSSTAGLYAGPMIASYITSKYAVTGLTEHLREDLAPVNIGVSLLLPGNVRTRIMEAGRNRPASLGGPEVAPADFAASRAARTDQGHDPLDVGAMVVRAIQNNELYVVMNPERKENIDERLKAIRDGFVVTARHRDSLNH
ncbi:MAG: short-chain dehydrogenase [Gammaproteobacteria bacterium]|jgi:NAD(P)-dependent dehydrogenase (short-subunit alcohol dehydrogenase family)|nr:short-chain dehydrogenase [Gammaproteobacteria bacterium]|tara:strand:+ start:15944 stop:16783 length:840 start_codon:yes stop_codon:yes gene_type:complete